MACSPSFQCFNAVQPHKTWWLEANFFKPATSIQEIAINPCFQVYIGSFLLKPCLHAEPISNKTAA